MQVYKSKKDASIPVNIILTEGPEKEPPDYPNEEEKSSVEDIMVVQRAYRLFSDFKGVIVDLTYGFNEWQVTREFFFKTSALDAFRIVEVELNFMYDLLYTKMVVVHGKYGFCFRILCLVLFAVALGLFVSHHKHHKHEIHGIDIYITYILLIGAIGLDIFGIIKLFLSDWTIAALSDIWIPDRHKNCKQKLLSSLFDFRINLSFDKNYRWSRSISQHSLVTYCLKKERFKWIYKLVYIFGAKEFVDEILYKKTVHVEENLTKLEKLWKLLTPRWMKVKEKIVGKNLKVFIFKELRKKAEKAKTAKEAKEICSWRGEKPLSEAPRCFTSLVESVEVEYDESVLRWHLATELCYHTDKDDYKEEKCQFSKVLSQYMLYLLVMRPTMMSQVTGILQIRFQDTCAEAKKFFGSGREPTRDAHEEAGKLFCNKLVEAIKMFFGFAHAPTPKGIYEVPKPDDACVKACEKLLGVDTVVAPGKVKGGTSKSVLFDACIMAKELKKLDKADRWELISKVWVELLCYAASHCKAHVHAQQLSKGGEFISFVWLLMFHFGMGEQFHFGIGEQLRVIPEHRYKLIAGKDYLEDLKS
ncbi:hypothetical protein L1049_001046 [Liquidambar formosana]|uniref:DUF4220 domain-containing protein n=1 Tax=Liquidambar formosana TaxID=63359 RepID=A0AAP0NBM0_LIQFO